MSKEDDCPPCTFFGALGELEDLCSVVAKKGAPLDCSQLGKQAEKEQLAIKDFMFQVQEQAKRLGYPHITKTINNLKQEVADHIRRQARGEKLESE